MGFVHPVIKNKRYGCLFLGQEGSNDRDSTPQYKMNSEVTNIRWQGFKKLSWLFLVLSWKEMFFSYKNSVKLGNCPCYFLLKKKHAKSWTMLTETVLRGDLLTSPHDLYKMTLELSNVRWQGFEKLRWLILRAWELVSARDVALTHSRTKIPTDKTL